MKIGSSINLSFKARLLSKPEQFVLPSDSQEDRQYIDDMFKMVNRVLAIPNVARYTPNDTIEFERKQYKDKFVYKMVYKTPDISESDVNKHIFENITLEGPGLKSVFNLPSVFMNLTYVVAAKRGISKQFGLFTPYKVIRDKTFDFTKEQSDKLPF